MAEYDRQNMFMKGTLLIAVKENIMDITSIKCSVDMG